MPLVDTRKMFAAANQNGFAIGAFNVNNMELLQGIVDACKEKNAPLILQISKGARKYANMKYLMALINVAVQESGLPIVVHLDHGDTFELCKQCIDEGFTSVMIDGSHHPYEENIKLTKQVCDYAHSQKVYVSVEAELGRLGGIEEDVVGVKEEDLHKFLTDPDQAEDFIKQTGCDSLAVACGTSHGAYKFKTAPKLAFDLLETLTKRMPGYPLVMHGSSSVPQELIEQINKFGGSMPNAMGVPEEALTQAGKLGVAKINIDTDLRLALTATIRKVFVEKPSEFDPRNYLGPAREAVKNLVAHKVEILGCAGKANLCL
ncbi:MAG: class II fructose-1,6-bisphosphate aldolase [Phycisphaerae bacterium]|jgi:fructose-bisphosphate aldolase class II|nr:class II fructose-1,6-bisphosphate aldolase [Phycisphaerae bacterium]